MAARRVTARQQARGGRAVVPWFVSARAAPELLTPEAIVRSLRGVPGAYVHVPFCARLCPFCPYNKEVHRPSRAARYFDALRHEAERYAAVLGSPFTSLYIGGGTPTLCLDGLERTIEVLPVRGERAIEVLPTHATPERLDRIRGLGITFVSIGVQSFDDAMLRHLGRPTTAADNVRAVEQAAGRFACVDVDLIFDVAFQAPDLFLADLEQCFRCGVEQVSTYPLMRFGFTPFGKARHDARAEHDALRRATALAARWGYERRSVWTFNRPGAPSYTSITRPFFLGLGAGSASFTGRWFLVNEFDVGCYTAAVEAGRLPVARALTLRPPADAAYHLFWQLYTGRVDARDLARHFGRYAALAWSAAARALATVGYVDRVGPISHLSSNGFERYHDLEQWVTYRYIEPLWAAMLPTGHPEAANGGAATTPPPSGRVVTGSIAYGAQH